MLSFTHNDRNQTSNDFFDPQPLIISNNQHRQPPQQPQKRITNTRMDSKRNMPSSRGGARVQSSKGQRKSNGKVESNAEWVTRGKIQTFDGTIHKNQLAEQQRRMRAEGRRKQKDSIREIAKNERGIKGKTLKLQQDQQKEIGALRKLIQKEQHERKQNQHMYEARVGELEKQRKELVQLQRKIQEHGVRHQQQYSREIKALQRNDYPTNDRAKCHQEVRSPQKKGVQFQISQSEAQQQRESLRQHQLGLLTQQRERCMQNQVTLDYNPTIIPLLSRTSYKLISTHVSTLVELLVDDMLEQQVLLLEEIELQQKLEREEARDKNKLQDYCQALEQFADDAEEIESRVGKYHTMQFQDLYRPKHFPAHHPQKYKTDFTLTYQLTGLNSGVVEDIEERRDTFVRFLSNFDEYRGGHLKMFEAVTQELLNEAIEKMAHELDRGSNDFVDLIFRKEFE